MGTWIAYFQINGEEFSRYPAIEFAVPDELYVRVVEAVDKMIPLVDCDFYHELLILAENALDIDEYTPGNDEEEYNEALEEFMSEYGDLADSMGVERCTIDDPGDLKRLNQRFVGKVFPEWAGKNSVNLEYEDDYGDTTYYLTVHVDDNGAVIDITDVSGSALESESCKSSTWGDCYPDYDLIAENLQEEFEAQNEED